MGRSPCCDEAGLKKGPWTPEEDEILVKYIKKHGHGSWRALPKLAGLNRCGKSCRLRWTNYLRPDIKRGKFSPEEENTILSLHAVLGNKWSAIASHLRGRTDNEIKNFWNTHLKKKLINMGFDPMTHRPRTAIFSSLPQLLALANLKELMDHHSIEEHALRLQAEAAVKLQFLQSLFQTTPPTNPPAINDGLVDADKLKLLTSISQFEANSGFGPIPVNSLDEINSNYLFSHLPELQQPCMVQPGLAGSTEFAGFSQESPNCPWQLPGSSKSSPHIVNANGDAGSSLSYDMPSCSGWPDLLLDDSLSF